MKNKHIWTADQKLEWLGDGEWIEEPDLVRFKCKTIKCSIKRVIVFEEDGTSFGGYLCGYVQVPLLHPWFGKDKGEMEVLCHGGITFSDDIEDEEGWGFWIGFDCGHGGDYVPSHEKIRRDNPISKHFPIPEIFKDCLLFYPEYRNIAYVTEECKSIVKQMKKAYDKWEAAIIKPN